jgi:hypothetical protein
MNPCSWKGITTSASSSSSSSPRVPHSAPHRTRWGLLQAWAHTFAHGCQIAPNHPALAAQAASWRKVASSAAPDCKPQARTRSTCTSAVLRADTPTTETPLAQNHKPTCSMIMLIQASVPCTHHHATLTDTPERRPITKHQLRSTPHQCAGYGVQCNSNSPHCASYTPHKGTETPRSGSGRRPANQHSGTPRRPPAGAQKESCHAQHRRRVGGLPHITNSTTWLALDNLWRPAQARA